MEAVDSQEFMFRQYKRALEALSYEVFSKMKSLDTRDFSEGTVTGDFYILYAMTTTMIAARLDKTNKLKSTEAQQDDKIIELMDSFEDFKPKLQEFFKL